MLEFDLEHHHLGEHSHSQGNLRDNSSKYIQLKLHLTIKLSAMKL